MKLWGRERLGVMERAKRGTILGEGEVWEKEQGGEYFDRRPSEFSTVGGELNREKRKKVGHGRSRSAQWYRGGNGKERKSVKGGGCSDIGESKRQGDWGSAKRGTRFGYKRTRRKQRGATKGSQGVQL